MNKAKILLVDDEENVLRALERLFRRRRYQVASFTSGFDALEAARSGEFQVVISDYRMPIIDGVDFLTQLRQSSPEITRIMLSGEADRDAILASINNAGIFRFATKPWDDEHLLEIVELAIAAHQRALETRIALDVHREMTDVAYRRKKAAEALEKESPGITQVNWSEDDEIVLDENA